MAHVWHTLPLRGGIGKSAHAHARDPFSIQPSTVLSFSHSRGRRHENHPSPSVIIATHTHAHEGPECARIPGASTRTHARACVRVYVRTYDVIDFMLSGRAVRRCCCAVHGPSSLFGVLRAASPRLVPGPCLRSSVPRTPVRSTVRPSGDTSGQASEPPSCTCARVCVCVCIHMCMCVLRPTFHAHKRTNETQTTHTQSRGL